MLGIQKPSAGLIDNWIRANRAEQEPPETYLTPTPRRSPQGMTARYVPKPGDFWVVQSDGYVYLNPAGVFERKYTTSSPSIGWAVRQMREGRRLRRKAWSAGVYAAYQPGYPDGVAINANTARATGLPQGTVCKFAAYIMQQIEPGVFIPWVCTQADPAGE